MHLAKMKPLMVMRKTSKRSSLEKFLFCVFIFYFEPWSCASECRRSPGDQGSAWGDVFMQKLAIYIVDSGNHEMIKTHISLSSTMNFASFIETEKQITCKVWHLHHMYYYFTNLASFRTLASLKILKIAKTSSIPPSSCLQPHHIIDSHHLCVSKKNSQS